MDQNHTRLALTKERPPVTCGDFSWRDQTSAHKQKLLAVATDLSAKANQAQRRTFPKHVNLDV